MKNLKKNFSNAFEGKVWNIESEFHGAYLVLEIRNEDDLTTSFYSYNPAVNELIRCNIEFEDSWWVGITFVVNDIILFHQFLDQENPQEKSYMAFNLVRQEFIWEKTGVNLSGFGRDYIHAVRGDERVTIDILSGSEEKTVNYIESTENKYIDFPFHYQPGSEYHVTVNTFLTRIGMDSDEKYGVDYLEKEGFVIISHYTNDNGLTNKLLVIDADKNIMLDEIIGQQLNGIADRPFFVYHHSLIFVRNNSDFLSYQLSHE